jgi:DNA-3-methyladenine glycosylase
MSRILGREFFARQSTIVAKDLVGKILVRNFNDKKLLRGIIVETEAYGGLRDPASHAFKGMTPRNEVMFGKAGFSYVYFTYGFHHCLNVVTGNKGEAQAVLIRALEPIDGIDVMQTLRGSNVPLCDLTNGPGKICQAFGIDRSLNKVDVTKKESPIFFESDSKSQEDVQRKIARSSRIGIKVGIEKRWRFYDPSSIYISHRSNVNLGLKQPRLFSRP